MEEVGPGVRAFEEGDFVATPFCFSDAACELCHAGLFTSCLHGGFWGSDGNDGGQGEFVRVPLADGTLRPIPEAVAHDEKKRASALTLTDVMSTIIDSKHQQAAQKLIDATGGGVNCVTRDTTAHTRR